MSDLTDANPFAHLNRKPNRTFGEKRTCLVCPTVLSRYNPSETCSVHGVWTGRKGRKPAERDR